MAHLSLVKSLSHLKEEQKYADEILLDSFGVATFGISNSSNLLSDTRSIVKFKDDDEHARC